MLRRNFQIKKYEIPIVEVTLETMTGIYASYSVTIREGLKSLLYMENPWNSSWLMDCSTSLLTGVKTGSSLVNSASKFATSLLLFCDITYTIWNYIGGTIICWYCESSNKRTYLLTGHFSWKRILSYGFQGKRLLKY